MTADNPRGGAIPQTPQPGRAKFSPTPPPKFRPTVAPLNSRGLDPRGSTVAQPAPMTAADRAQRKAFNNWTELASEG